MALPLTGPLSFSNIYTEIEGSHGTEAVPLDAMRIAASKTRPIAVSDFYGYTSSMDLYYGSTTYDVNTATQISAYRPIVRDTQQSSQTISVTLNYLLFVFDFMGTSNAELNYRSNGGVWALVDAAQSPSGSTGGSYTITDISSTDTIDIQLVLNDGGTGFITANVNIQSASVTSGGGSINITDPSTWDEEL